MMVNQLENEPTSSHNNKKCGNCKNWSYFDWVRGACIRWGNKVNPGDEDWCCGDWEVGDKINNKEKNNG